MKYLSVFSGMEAASVAWEPLGFKPVGFSEIEPFPSAILTHRFPNIPNYGDITKHKQWPIGCGSADILVGGSPCQSFSVAGLRKGLEDPRGHLMLTFLSLADRIRPRWIVWENVPGVLSSNGGRDFGAFIGALGQLGYGFAWRVLDAQHFAVPQRRRRVFLVATSTGDERLAGEVLSIPEGLRGYLDEIKQKGKASSTGSDGGFDKDCEILWNGSDQANAERVIDMAGTLNCDKGQRGGYIVPYRKQKRAQSNTDYESWVHASEANTLNNFDLGDTRTTHAIVDLKSVRRLTPLECERLQGFPDNWSRIPWKGKPEAECPDGPRYKACGNSMAVPVMRWIGKRILEVEGGSK